MSEVTTDTPAETTPDTATAPAAGAASAIAATPAPAAPSPAPAPKPKAAPAVDKPEPAADRPDPVALALKSLQADNAGLAASLAAMTKRAEAAERERDKATGLADALSKRAAEGAIVSRLRDLVPAGVPEIDLRGALAALAESGKVDRYGADADAMAKAAHEALKAANSSILRAAPPPGGPAGAPPQALPARRHVSAAG